MGGIWVPDCWALAEKNFGGNKTTDITVINYLI
jgi:hypothetical protein